MGFAIGQPIIWPAPPNWATAPTETLAFLTDVMHAATGGAQARALRDAPRRSFAFSCALDGDTRRLIDALRFDIGVQPLMLPIYPDVQWLAAPLVAGVSAIPCATAGFDFVAGGQALLFRDARTWELVTVDAIAADSLTLTAPTSAAYGPGDRLYPVRRARLLDAPKASHLSGDVATVDVQAMLDEPCDWPAAWPTATTYRSQPVIEWRNEESEDPTDEYDRRSGSVDADTGPVFYFDLPGMPFRTQSQRFVMHGRDQHSAFRALAYQLNGRAAQCWVPSWQADVRLAVSVTASAKQLSVPWIGYTQFGYLQRNRRDLAIELNDGSRLYRRITGSAETGDTEVLQLDSALGRALAPGEVRQIGWLTLCAQAADTVTIEHVTDADGTAVATLNWAAVKSDV